MSLMRMVEAAYIAKEANQHTAAMLKCVFVIRSVNIHRLEKNTIVYTMMVGMTDLEFELPAGFEWDEEKSKANLIKHGLDFEDASEVFYGPVIIRGSNRNCWERWIAVGKSHDRIVSVIFTRRNDLIRIISARRSETK
jgi:uncharacterized protein